MTTRSRMISASALVVAMFIVLAALVPGAGADSLFIDFQSYTVGNINGQDGWMKTGGYDVAVVDQASLGLSYPGFGNRSLRISNAVTSGSFGDQAFSKPLVNEAGETAAANNGMSGGARQPYYEAQWEFASAVPGAEQPGLSAVASPDRGDGARMSWVQMADTPTGLVVRFNDYASLTPGTCDGAFTQTDIATGLDRTVKHTIRITMGFVDGTANDVVNVYVDGALAHTGTSWEDYFRDCQPPESRTVDSILFRVGGTAAPATSGYGFLIDNFSQYSGPVPCTTVCYVDDAGSDANGGTGPADAFQTIQKGIDAVQPGGEVRVLAGTYPESPNVNKSLTLVGVAGRDATTIQLQSQPVAPTYLGALMVDADVVTVQGFTVQGFDADCDDFGVDGDQDDASTNIMVTSTPDTVVIKDNRFKVGAKNPACTTYDDAIGVANYYNETVDVASLTVENNLFQPLNAGAGRAFYINPGADEFVFRGNTITGNFTAASYTQAKNGLVENNTVTGTGASRGLGTWGYPDPTVYGKTLFQNNTISDVVNGITIYWTENVTVTKNVFTGNDRAVYVAEDDPFDLSTIHINRNSIDGNAMGVENWYTTDVDATCNWWGAADGPGPVGPGGGDNVSANVAFGPWLKTADLDGLCFKANVFVSASLPGMTGDGVAFGGEDVLMWDGAAWSVWFDGSDAGLEPKGKWMHNLNAIHIPDPGAETLYLTFTQNARVVPGIPGKVDGMDIVKWDGAAFSLWFDGSDVALTAKTPEKIDALHILPGNMSPIGANCQAYLLVSTQGPGSVPNPAGGKPLKFGGEDVLGFCMTNWGTTTTGLWHIALDGSTQGMPKNSLDSLSASADGMTYYLTTRANFNVDGAQGGHSMVYVYDVATQEFSGPVFSAPAEGLPKKVDALHVELLP